MRWRRAVRIGVAAVAALAVGGVLAAGLVKRDGAGTPSLPVTLEPNAAAPDLTGTTLSGQRFDLATLRGTVVVINVMASWCAPCRAELPVLVAGARRWRTHDIEMVGLAMRDDPDDARTLLRDTGAQTFEVVEDPDGTRAISLGVRGVPETLIVDRSGTVRYHAFGPINADWLDRYLPALEAT
jgi:cytochrome c biogenesis protein CcmG/thiol:disulfide interchange protein DsbE